MLTILQKGVKKNFYDERFFPFSTGVNDTGGAPCSTNISEHKKKKLKWP
jgi:hypothetical protein